MKNGDEIHSGEACSRFIAALIALFSAFLVGACAPNGSGLSGGGADGRGQEVFATTDDDANGSMAGGIPGPIAHGTDIGNPEVEGEISTPPSTEEGLRLERHGCALISPVAMSIRDDSTEPADRETLVLTSKAGNAAISVTYFFPASTREERLLSPEERLTFWVQTMKLARLAPDPDRRVSSMVREEDGETTLAAALNAPVYLLLKGDTDLMRKITIIDLTQRVLEAPAPTQPREIKKDIRELADPQPEAQDASRMKEILDVIRGKKKEPPVMEKRR